MISIIISHRPENMFSKKCQILSELSWISPHKLCACCQMSNEALKLSPPLYEIDFTTMLTVQSIEACWISFKPKYFRRVLKNFEYYTKNLSVKNLREWNIEILCWHLKTLVNPWILEGIHHIFIVAYNVSHYTVSCVNKEVKDDCSSGTFASLNLANLNLHFWPAFL